MLPNLLSLDEKRFEELCQDLLREEYPGFQTYSAPDLGMDGYDPKSGTIFQCYFPEGAPRKDKVAADIEKARQQPCKKWVLLIPKNPTQPFHRWLTIEQQSRVEFPVDVWGKTKIQQMLRSHPGVERAHFRTRADELLERLSRGKKPASGDAMPGGEIEQDQAEELRSSMGRLVDEEVSRKHRKPKGLDYSREYGEFNKHFALSSYGRLPREKFAEARRYLEAKLYSRRKANTRSQDRNRIIGGVKAIQKKLAIREPEYRQILIKLTGKNSLAILDNEELSKVFKYFHQLQGEADARGC
ncbi:MAG TPA: hypothetical protein VMX16_05700 [Terriglobia bacterium]|nr:hypothetical protein [Terriglobia bacterium]